MKFFKNSKNNLEKFKQNAKSFFQDFRDMQYSYLQLLFKKNRTAIESIEFKRLKKENFRLSVFLIFCLTPIPFVTTLYFIIIPRFFWPMTLRKILKV